MAATLDFRIVFVCHSNPVEVIGQLDARNLFSYFPHVSARDQIQVRLSEHLCLLIPLSAQM